MSNLALSTCAVCGYTLCRWRFSSPNLSQITFECRKLMHMLFIPFIVAICFHGSVLMAEGTILLVWYLLDRLYFTTKM